MQKTNTNGSAGGRIEKTGELQIDIPPPFKSKCATKQVVVQFSNVADIVCGSSLNKT